MTLAFWSTIALLLAGALLFVLPPMLRPPAVQAGPSPLSAYREQRAQIDSAMQRGNLTREEYAQALAELQGRVVNEVGELQQPPAAANGLPPRGSIVALSLLLPVAALALYSLLGSPEALAPAQARAASGSEAPHTLSSQQVEQMVEGLATKLKKSPDDAAGWHMLARSYVAIGRLPEAAQAYDRASALAPRDAQVLTDYADTLAMVNGRSLEGRPTQLVEAALKIDPAHPKALALAGTAAFNRGEFAAAVAFWRKLQAVLPPESDQARSIASSISQAQAAAAKARPPAATNARP